MALTITPITQQKTGAGLVVYYYNFTAAGSGDTLSVTVAGIPLTAEFFNPNATSNGAGQIVTNPPTFAAWAAGTIAGTSTATLTANSGGVVTSGVMVLTTTAQ